MAIFLLIRLVYIPGLSSFVFGAHNLDMPQQIMLAGLLRLLVRMLDE